MAIPDEHINRQGRRPGTPNKITTKLKTSILDFLDNNWLTVQTDFDNLEPKDRLTFILKLIEYALPKKRALDTNRLIEGKIDSMSEEKINEVINIILDEDE